MDAEPFMQSFGGITEVEEDASLDKLGFWQVLKHFDIWTVAMCIALSLMCLTYKEPILALKLAKHSVDVMNVGIIFSLDTIMYTFTSMILNFVKEEDDGKKYGKIQYYGLLFFVASMLLTGPAHALEEQVEIVHINNDLSTLIAGILLAGVGGALVNNNSTPAMILTEHEESEKRL